MFLVELLSRSSESRSAAHQDDLIKVMEHLKTTSTVARACCTMHSGHSIVPWVVLAVEKCWSLANPHWLIFLWCERDLDIPPRSSSTMENLLGGSTIATSPMGTWSEQTTGLVRPLCPACQLTMLVGRELPGSRRHTTEAEGDRRLTRLLYLTLKLFFPQDQAHQKKT